jgi:hypothetical protein
MATTTVDQIGVLPAPSPSITTYERVLAIIKTTDHKLIGILTSLTPPIASVGKTGSWRAWV